MLDREEREIDKEERGLWDNGAEMNTENSRNFDGVSIYGIFADRDG
jgi:hypothetical protein